MTSYKSRLKITIDGDEIRLFTPYGVVLGNGYERVVISKRGPYVEFTGEQINLAICAVPKDEEWRLESKVAYYVELRTLADNIKIYYQLKTVAYADYKVDFYYVSPFDLTLDDGTPIITKLKGK